MPSVHNHSRTKHGWHLLGSLGLVGMGVFLLRIQGTGSVLAWLTLILAGGLAAFYLFGLLNPDTRFLVPGSEVEKAYRRTTEGPYKYFPDGFTVKTHDEYEGTAFEHHVLWQEIDEIKLHKIKSPDRLYQGLRIYYRNAAHKKVLETNETYEGCFVLVERLKANMEGITPDWQFDAPAAVHQQTEKTVWRKGGNDG